MAFETILPIANRQAGTYVSPSVALTAGQRITLRLTANQWTDVTLEIRFMIDRSLDGGTNWEPWLGGTTIGGALDKNGNLPSISIATDVAITARATAILNQSARLGLEAERL